MGKKTKIKLPKSVQKSDKTVQEKYIKAYKKSLKKHDDKKRAHKKAISKLQKKYQKVDKRWIHQDDVAAAKSAAKAAKKKADSKKSDSKKPVAKKSDAKKKDKKQPKHEELILETPIEQDLDAEQTLELYEEELPREDALPEEITKIGAAEGANPEETEDPVAAQEAFEDALVEPDLAAALEEEPATDVQPAATSPQSLTAGRLIEDVTRAELYKEAQELKIPGRASMNKEQLFAAIELAQQ